MKTAQLRRAMRAALGAAPQQIGIFDAGREADTLLCLQLRCDTASLLLRAEQPLSDADCEEAMKLCARRLAGEPLQYICGETDFFGLRFAVRPGVLIPRQDSEILAEEALREEIGGTVYDFCCGSGCLLLSVLQAREELHGIGVDLSDEALALSRENARRHGLSARARFEKYDVLNAAQPLSDAALVLCNPPYIRSAVCDELDRTVLQEPRMALCGGEDGLLFYRTLIPYFHAVLPQGARVLFEIGYDQGGLLAFAKRYFPLAELKKDYCGNDRMLILRQTKPKTEQKQT